MQFTDYFGGTVNLSSDALEHIKTAHSEVSLAEIAKALAAPSEVRKSSYRDDSELYYCPAMGGKFICVVVKTCMDGKFISTAMTTGKSKSGQVIYVRK